MGRRRLTHLHLPAHVYLSKGRLFYEDDHGKWHLLGKEWDGAAKAKWVELSTGKATDGSVAKLLDDFLTHAETLVRAGKRSPRTLDDNEAEAVQLKKAFGRMHYRAVTSKHCATYLRKRAGKDGKLAPTRANRELALLSSAYAWAMGEDRYEVTTNPCYGVRRNTETPRDRYVETWELRKFLKGHRHADGTLHTYAPPWLRGYVLLKRLLGDRQGTMLTLHDGHVTDRGLEYRPNKRGRPKIVRWSSALRVVVRWTQHHRPELDHPQPENVERLHPRPLFPTRFDSHYTARGFKSAWQRAMQAYAADGFARFWEHDIRAKVASDAHSDEEGGALLDHAPGSRTTRRHYRRAPVKRMPAR